MRLATTVKHWIEVSCKLNVFLAPLLRSGGDGPRSDGGRAAARGWSDGCTETRYSSVSYRLRALQHETFDWRFPRGPPVAPPRRGRGTAVPRRLLLTRAGHVPQVLRWTQGVASPVLRCLSSPEGTNMNSRGLSVAMRSEAHGSQTIPSSNPERVEPSQCRLPFGFDPFRGRIFPPTDTPDGACLRATRGYRYWPPPGT